jgi:type IV pilus assembly protein PilA
MFKTILKMKKGDQRGFTLIELLVVVAIIAILAAIAIPQYSAYRQRAFDSAALSDVKTIQTASEAFFADKNVYPLEASEL